MRRILALLVLAGFVAGCSDRPRLNPLDPANAVTGGAPQGFAALADDGFVLLSWAPPPAGVALGVRLFRATGATAEPESLVDLPFGVTQYFDTGLANGTDYRYRLAYVLQNGALSGAVSDIATPGTARPWVADFSAGTLERVTPDGRRIAETVGGRFETPVSLDVNADGRVWLCDLYGGRVWRVTPGLSTEEVGNHQLPVAVAIDRKRARAWVTDQGLNSLQGFDAMNPGAPDVFTHNLARPIDVAVDPADGSVWVCERTGDRVRHIGYAGEALGSAVMPQPSRVAVDTVTRRIWVSSLTARQVVAFTPSGVPVDTIAGLTGPVGIAIDSAAGSIWVADTDADRVIVFDRSGHERFRVNNVYQPLEIAIDRASGEAWVVQPSAGQVSRIAANGQVLRQLRGFAQPYDIAL